MAYVRRVRSARQGFSHGGWVDRHSFLLSCSLLYNRALGSGFRFGLDLEWELRNAHGRVDAPFVLRPFRPGPMMGEECGQVKACSRISPGFLASLSTCSISH